MVIGAPNIQEFAPSNNSLLHIKELKDAESVANTMKYLAANPSAYNELLRYDQKVVLFLRQILICSAFLLILSVFSVLNQLFFGLS